MMNWEWLQYWFDDRIRPAQMILHRHLISSFRIILLGGDLLILLGIWQFHELLLKYWEYSAWLAGLSATLVVLFLCTIASASIRGYHLLHDRWLTSIVGTMLFISTSCALLVVLPR
jgi:hypothetical protein